MFSRSIKHVYGLLAVSDMGCFYCQLYKILFLGGLFPLVISMPAQELKVLRHLLDVF